MPQRDYNTLPSILTSLGLTCRIWGQPAAGDYTIYVSRYCGSRRLDLGKVEVSGGRIRLYLTEARLANQVREMWGKSKEAARLWD